ncbi:MULTISPECIES: Asp-tRNA(Asn)/Glu-tRNA(Gln) amidotransferase subunit GatC [Auritidibacter]|uniref:Asp-tRNA(Asn)/Glu-tRNA(Gln) amidotransferase subunit GatC n=1 Tax=Auritidibacter TaxID=1160973 RepID=UPI000D737ADE|nr:MULTISPECIES: Asp-tRNA(Asn)/Glu-tRNA(Gln) amidotransferase subunit GatC [Auritidibacter]PXA80096.1 Asp-tRNA(Asn)/Glu-tRNA(Gln) amidotransferase GatCAB subunit C [Auritidibacter sp. NML120636]WGH84812.1 Asp-tRNA(Asn)/Glu-tRNA(Gln) amidotransferase subunit GatC [Auritidibacter ignavus]WGH87189.1 Asp-tRNA(Asn)/Glu-tRNA(Gln) amidotransferase subunit GatC [Auritidibacter ignavus]WGH89475.1 Asp-tRNA(Asn)/Glu-tRNA(Gln) amidotransferase subunit GatC [Auritidibacter ignavus]
MSGISRETVAHLAQLARIDLTPEELDRFCGELDLILKSTAMVQEAAGDDVPPTSHPMPLTNVFREDEVSGVLTQDQALGGAPDAEDGQFKVPSILEAE